MAFKGTQDFFASYLANRKQCLYLNGFSSSYLAVETGAPLGPILCSLHVNDFSSILTTSKVVLYADNTTVVFWGKSLRELEAIINSEIRQINDWFNGNKLRLNRLKTNNAPFLPRNQFIGPSSLKIILDGTVLGEVRSIKYLGIAIDSQ